MKKLIIGVIAGSILTAATAQAYRIVSPTRITDYDQRGLVVINDNFKKIWDITNGRYNIDITEINPDGTDKGDVGDIILLNNSGDYYLEVNVNGGTTWRGVALTDTP